MTALGAQDGLVEDKMCNVIKTMYHFGSSGKEYNEHCATVIKVICYPKSP